jgi:hypothetical protein
MTEDIDPWRAAQVYRGALERVGMTILDAAWFFDVNERTARRWADGTIRPPLSAMLCLTLMMHHRMTVDDINKLLGKED